MSKSKLRGHVIIYTNGEWLYENTKTPTVGSERPCGYCGMSNTEEGHDGCLGILPGPVMNACCGHGQEAHAYIQYLDGSDLRGKDAMNVMISLIEAG